MTAAAYYVVSLHSNLACFSTYGKCNGAEIQELRLKRRMKRLKDLDTKPDMMLIRIEQNLIKVNVSLKEVIRLSNTKC